MMTTMGWPLAAAMAGGGGEDEDEEKEEAEMGKAEAEEVEMGEAWQRVTKKSKSEMSFDELHSIMNPS